MAEERKVGSPTEGSGGDGGLIRMRMGESREMLGFFMGGSSDEIWDHVPDYNFESRIGGNFKGLMYF